MKFLVALLSLNLLWLSCKKESIVDEVADAVEFKQGMLRVECNACEIKYIINKKEFKETIRDGNGDFSFSYRPGYNLKTQILSKQDQSIRLLILDANGEVISNELNSYVSGEVINGSFDMVLE